MKRVTGIGGVFFKAKDPKALGAWYAEHLGLEPGAEGAPVLFGWREKDQPEQEGVTVWSLFKDDTTYFEPSRSPFMINYRVEDLDAVLAALKGEGVTVEKREDSAYGKFAWVMDPEGNRVELWEPPKAPPP
jgi:catechol 2,3-dioxygenase-like lactoylglutathione lyase family enzyme